MGAEQQQGTAQAYSGFAQVYDALMDNVPYDEWTAYLISLLRQYGAEGGIAADLGCGTGKVTRRLARAGYDMIGIDSSVEMLGIARENSPAGILYLQQDMRSFELYGTVRACVSLCDSMNYLLSEEDLLQVFRLVNNYLDPGGVFIFDMNTIYKYREVLGEQTIAENREDCAFIWDNYYYGQERVNEYDLNIFVREQNGLYRKYREIHYQKGYEPQQVCALLEEAGLKVRAVYDAFTRNAPRPDSQRLYFIAQECSKKKELPGTGGIL